MAEKPIISKRYNIKGYDSLEKLALNFAWQWYKKPSASQLWEQLHPELWELLHNPWVVLQTVSKETLERKLADPVFCKQLDELLNSYDHDAKAPAWFQQKYSSSSLKCVAYFSMEYMLAEALPIYSGGLGNVAGDQLKAASDLGVPVIAIGMLYQRGYFRQVIDKEGAQHALYPYNDPGQLPIIPLRKSNGEWLRFEIQLPGWSVWLRAWEVKVGKVLLYLLDSNDAVNFPAHRGITSELYGGDAELRFKQELVLGIGGWRLLDALGIKPDVCHLNEGHAAFAVLERARCFMQETKEPFSVALEATRAGNLFTTHTAVPAGFDRFPPSFLEQYLGKYAKNDLGISIEELLSLGRLNPKDREEYFNMAYLAVRGSGAINGVSELHAKVSRYIFSPLFPRFAKEEIPIGSVTNGVHMPSWSSVQADTLWTEYCGKNTWLGTAESSQKNIRNVPDAKLWQMRTEGRKAMLEYARTRLARIWEARGFPPEEIERAKHLFDPNTLTLGFARRFATYKRPNMLLYDVGRFLRILTNPQRPVQLIISGKAHPADLPGQAMIQQWVRLFDRPEARSHVIFLSDYDMQVTQNLVQGVDLWINTPRRPWEACGTSGMKVLANGGLNLSELDGWWAEAYSPKFGWAVGDRHEHGDDPSWDAAEANHLYDLLEKEVVPAFYTRDAEGIPTEWIARIRESMAQLSPHYSADRSVREYTEKYYLPAEKNYHNRAKDQARLAKQIVNWKKDLQNNWIHLRFEEVKVETKGDQHLFNVQVYLNNLNPDAVKVDIFANATPEREIVQVEMARIRPLSGNPNSYLYQASVSASRPIADYTPRILPHLAEVSTALEAPLILWQK